MPLNHALYPYRQALINRCVRDNDPLFGIARIIRNRTLIETQHCSVQDFLMHAHTVHSFDAPVTIRGPRRQARNANHAVTAPMQIHEYSTLSDAPSDSSSLQGVVPAMRRLWKDRRRHRSEQQEGT